MSLTEFNGQTSNEAIQVQLAIYAIRDEVLRMAPWNAATNVINLTYITSAPGSPENPSQLTPLWTKGQPSPPWTYEYQYPVDCLRPLWVIPATQMGFAGGVPITTAVTGGTANVWTGPAAKFKVGIDQFFAVVGATVASLGGGYQVGDLITLFSNPIFGAGFSSGFVTTNQPPLGAPAILQVTSINGFGGITGIAVVNTFQQAQPENSEPVSGSYFAIQPSPLPQASTTGLGAGATFNLTWSAQMDQRIILTNQEFATLCYIKQVQDPNIMDPLLIQAWIAALGARLIYQLSGDKSAANLKIAEANAAIMEARKADGNEGLTINDVTPDWIRIRGVNYPNWEYSPNFNFDWGSYFSPY
jgi:hypothetical protein